LCQISEKKQAEKEVEQGKYFTINQIADVFEVDRRTIYRWFNMGALQYFSLKERRTVITETQYRKFLEKRKGTL
jgi:predicted site-specific integrase-resolvase